MTPKKIDRRALLGLFAVGAPFMLMGAQCATTIGSVQTGATVAAQLVADVQGLASGLTAQFPSIAGTLSSDALTKVQAGLTTLSGLAGSLSTSMSQSGAQPVISQVVTVVGQIAQLAGPLLPPPWGLAVSAALALLPIISQAVGLAVAPQAGGMTPEQARVILGIKTVS